MVALPDMAKDFGQQYFDIAMDDRDVTCLLVGEFLFHRFKDTFDLVIFRVAELDHGLDLVNVLKFMEGSQGKNINEIKGIDEIFAQKTRVDQAVDNADASVRTEGVLVLTVEHY